MYSSGSQRLWQFFVFFSFLGEGGGSGSRGRPNYIDRESECTERCSPPFWFICFFVTGLFDWINLKVSSFLVLLFAESHLHKFVTLVE